MNQQASVEVVTLNPFLWSESDFLVLLAVAFAIAVFVAYVITSSGRESVAPGVRMTAIELAALQDAGTLVDAVEIDLLAKGVLRFDEKPKGLFGEFKKRHTRFEADLTSERLSEIQCWAVAKLIERGALEWLGKPCLSVVASHDAYRKMRGVFVRNGWFRPQSEVQQQRLFAIAPFALPLMLELGWIASHWQTSQLAILALVVTLFAALIAYTNQSELSDSSHAHVEQMREEFHDRSGARLSPEEFAMAFAAHGYSALFGSRLEEFAHYRIQQRKGD